MGSNLEPTGMTVSPIANIPASTASIPTDNTATTTEPAAKKVKKEKDPNAPKRPLNAYFLFQRDYRLKLKASHPEASFAEVQQLMNEAWDKMPFEEKTRYENVAKGLYEEYNKELRKYKGQSSANELKTETASSNTPNPIEPQVIETKAAELPIAITVSSDAEPAKKKKKKKNRENRESKEESESQE